MQLGFAEVENDKDVIIEDVTEMSVNAVNVVYEVDGPTSYALNGSTSGVGSSYSIAPLPPANATFSWKLQGGVVEDTSIQISITAVLICMMPDLIVYLV